MTILRRYWLAIFFTAVGFAISAAMYGHLPQRIPVHWNFHGEVNGSMPKQKGAFIIPLVAGLILILMIALAPKATRESESSSLRRVYPATVAAIAAFLLYMTIMILLVGAGTHLDIQAYTWIGAGILFMIVGNSLGKITQNGVVGIRTPWTLANEEVWSRTHRLGGWLFVLAGLVTTIAGMLGHGKIVGLAALVAASTVSVGYSYVISRHLK